jgi:signal transduction histidine kinase
MLFDIVAEEADRLNRIVSELLDFARPSPPALRPEPLDRILDEAVAAALAGTDDRIALVREVPNALPLIPMDARLIRQAILNVALNAVQAMSEGGTLTVRARLAGDTAVVELADTGPGIPSELRRRIFEPFFTTKATGTGLGLTVLKRILDDHRGRVEVRGGEQRGTVFALHLPLGCAPVENGRR